MNREELRARLDAARDARVDPLDDPELLSALESDDDALLEVAAWNEIERELAPPLATAPSGARLEPRRPSTLGLALTAAAAVLLAGAAWLAFRSPMPPEASTPRPIAASEAVAAPLCEVLGFRASIEVVSTRGTSRWEQDGFGDRGVSHAAREHRVSLVATASASPRELNVTSPVGVSHGVIR